MKEVVDISTWERRGVYDFFSTFVNPFVSITGEILCTGVKSRAKERGESLFLRSLYGVLKGVNAVKEFRYRINAQDQVVLYDTIDALVAVADGMGGFSVRRIPYIASYEKFVAQAAQRMKASLLEETMDVAATAIEEDQLNVVFVSAMPSFPLTAFTSAQENKHGSSYPLVTMGQIRVYGTEERMPIALSFHHGFADGAHVQRLYDEIEQILLQ